VSSLFDRSAGTSPETGAPAPGEETPPGGAGPLEEQVRAAQERLRALSKRAAKAATALSPLAKPAAYADLQRLGVVLDKVDAKMPADLPQESGVPELLRFLRRWKNEAGTRLRRQLGRELRGACERAGLGFRVVSSEDPVEVRIPPFAVVLDFQRGRAELRFARVPLATCPAETTAILDAHELARKALGARFDGARFFERCLRAWRAARAAGGQGNERVEILDFLPYLAVEMQGPKFRVEPTGGNFEGYGRARFAWDVLRLRRARMLSHDGMRLNLGVATGATASQKKRVLYFEDEDGNGEYKLTIFFTRSEEGRA